MTTAYPDDRRPPAPDPDDLDDDELDELDDLDDELDELDELGELDELDDRLDDRLVGLVAPDGNAGSDGESGQATTEYALVLLGAALVALLLIGWATSGGGAGKVGHLLDAVLDAITSKL